MENREFFASWSGGADSTAQIILAIEHGEPMTAAVYCEIMYDKTRSAEVPEHRDFIYERAIPWMERNGVQVIVLRSTKTALDWMMSRVTKGPRTGKIHGFPLSGRQGWCSVKRECKLPPLDRFRKEHQGAVYYEGICIDEPGRIKEEKEKTGAYLLKKYGYTQEMSRGLCRKAGLLSPIYGFAKRGGCFFCPNASDGELRHLWEYHRDLWNELKMIGENPEVVRPRKFRIDEGLSEIEERFLFEKKQMNLLEGPPPCYGRFCGGCQGCGR